MYYIFFIRSPVEGHLGCFHVLAIVNSSAMNIGVQVHFRIMVFSGYVPRSGIAGSYGSSIFSFLRSLHTRLHSTPTILPNAMKTLRERNLERCHAVRVMMSLCLVSEALSLWLLE